MENIIIYELNKLYPTGIRVTNKDLKRSIQDIYDRSGYKAHAKGTDILKYGYHAKKVKIRIDRKRVDGVELAKI